MDATNYHPESYWNEVAKRMAGRNGSKLIAGDDEPYYRYKRKQFLKLLHRIPFAGKVVLEVGCGPGGNLIEIAGPQPKELHGVDVSGEMLGLAKETVQHTPARLQKMDGTAIPFTNNYFDITFTSTVLQHNTDEAMLSRLIGEMCRVTGSEVYCFERIENRIKGNALCLGRPVAYYEKLFSTHGFRLKSVTFLNIQLSYLVSGAIRKLFNARTKSEGEPMSRISCILQRSTLPFTSTLDPFIASKRELAMLHFVRLQQ
jgi:ubiquinone/menaquinone biosynthesis C-methylase UbiE